MILTAIRRGASVVLLVAIAALLLGRWSTADARSDRPSPVALEALAPSWSVLAVRPTAEGRHVVAATPATLPVVGPVIHASASLSPQGTWGPATADDVGMLGRSERAPPG